MTLKDRVINREYIIAKIRQSYTDLLYFYHSLPAETLAEPAFSNGWSIKDMYANVSAWIWRCAAILDAASMSDGILLAKPDVRGLRREFYQNCKNWNWREVEQDFQQAHQALLEIIERISDERLSAKSVQKTLDREVYKRHVQCWTKLEQWQNDIANGNLLPDNSSSLTRATSLPSAAQSDGENQSANYSLFYLYKEMS